MQAKKHTLSADTVVPVCLVFIGYNIGRLNSFMMGNACPMYVCMCQQLCGSLYRCRSAPLSEIPMLLRVCVIFYPSVLIRSSDDDKLTNIILPSRIRHFDLSHSPQFLSLQPQLVPINSGNLSTSIHNSFSS
jgi:hypothetical protein